MAGGAPPPPPRPSAKKPKPDATTAYALLSLHTCTALDPALLHTAAHETVCCRLADPDCGFAGTGLALVRATRHQASRRPPQRPTSPASQPRPWLRSPLHRRASSSSPRRPQLLLRTTPPLQVARPPLRLQRQPCSWYLPPPPPRRAQRPMATTRRVMPQTAVKTHSRRTFPCGARPTRHRARPLHHWTPSTESAPSPGWTAARSSWTL